VPRVRLTVGFDPCQGGPRGAGLSSCGSLGPRANSMYTRSKPAWILIANTTRARVLQQEPGAAMVVLESFVHPAGRGLRSEPLLDARQKECTRFAHELAQFLEHEARQAHFSSLTIFASPSFAEELRAGLGRNTGRLLAGIHELDLTSVGIAELERRVSHELLLAAH
jgi:protein required for attachment to host cells